MEILRDTKIDFMKYRRFWVGVSAFFLLVAVFAIFIHGQLNLGIDFAGGTQLTVKFQERPEIDDLRSLVVAAGIDDPQIQRFGEAGDNEVILKTPLAEDTEEGSRRVLVEALDRAYNAEIDPAAFDLNRRGSAALADLLFEHDPEGLASDDPEAARRRYEEAADAVIAAREEEGLFEDLSRLETVAGLSDGIREVIRGETRLGAFAVLASENVGPQIGAELRRKGILAVVLSLIGMLVYIWMRFELRFGVGALVAVTHDVLIVLGLFTLLDFEFNLTTIAAFLTLVGYSVNDTVVVFDRVRENLRQSRRLPLVEVMNLSLNQTLSRTVLTSGTTLLVVGCLLVAGGDVLRGFAFILTIGIVVGTYSSIYVASPFTLLWENLFGREARLRRSEGR